MENLDVSVLEIVQLSLNGTIPVQQNDFQAGWDLFSATDCVVQSKTRLCIPTDIAVGIPRGCYGRIAPRSGMAARNGIDIGAGVIDSDFRGHVYVLMVNNGESEFLVFKGMKIAQLIIEKHQICVIKVINNLTVNSWTKTERGEKGFGSTGCY